MNTQPFEVKPEDLLHSEFEQTWQHYRHVENSRSQYLGFFFTAAFAVSTAAISMLGTKPIDTPWILPCLAALGAVLSAVTALVFFSVAKAGPVLSHYEHARKIIRDMADSHLEELPQAKLRSLDLRNSSHPALRRTDRLSRSDTLASCLLSMQNAALLILLVASVTIPILEIYAEWVGWQRNLLVTGIQRLVMSVLVGWTVLVACAVLWVAWKVWLSRGRTRSA